MKFEEILPLLREGKKAKNIGYGDDGQYWQVTYQSFLDGEKTLTLCRYLKDGRAITDRYSWGMPLWLIMSEEWEIFE